MSLNVSWVSVSRNKCKFYKYNKNIIFKLVKSPSSPTHPLPRLCSLVWMFCSRWSNSLVHMIQKSAHRVVYYDPNRTSLKFYSLRAKAILISMTLNTACRFYGKFSTPKFQYQEIRWDFGMLLKISKFYQISWYWFTKTYSFLTVEIVRFHKIYTPGS